MKEEDPRSDIWAFCAVLYEMVTGQKAFQGKSYSSLVGAILSADPAPMVVKPFTPSWLERLVRRCLAKDPEDRWQSMRDVVIELRTPPQELPPLRAGPIAVGCCGGDGADRGGPRGPLLPRRQHIVPKPAWTSSPTDPTPGAFALSPDWAEDAYVATTDGASRLQVSSPRIPSRRSSLPGTENARNPFWSRRPGPRLLRRSEAQAHRPRRRTTPDPVGVNSGAAQGAADSEGTILFNPGFANGPLLRIPPPAARRWRRQSQLKETLVTGHPAFSPAAGSFFSPRWGRFQPSGWVRWTTAAQDRETPRSPGASLPSLRAPNRRANIWRRAGWSRCGGTSW